MVNTASTSITQYLEVKRSLSASCSTLCRKELTARQQPKYSKEGGFDGHHRRVRHFPSFGLHQLLISEFGLGIVPAGEAREGALIRVEQKAPGCVVRVTAQFVMAFRILCFVSVFGMLSHVRCACQLPLVGQELISRQTLTIAPRCHIDGSARSLSCTLPQPPFFWWRKVADRCGTEVS